MIERRKHPRTSIRYRVFFECMDVQTQTVLQDIGTVRDISPKGMLLESTRPIQAVKINVIFPLQDGDDIRVQGSVVYAIPKPEGIHHIGIVFEKVENGLIQMIEKAS